MSNRVIDHLSDNDRQFLQTISFVPPPRPVDLSLESSSFFGEIYDLFDAAVFRPVDGIWGDQPHE